MSRVLVSGLCLACVLAGCERPADQASTAYYQQNLEKPVVALVPLIDSTLHQFPWSLSDELTSSIHYRLTTRDKLYLVDEQKVRTVAQKLNDPGTPFSPELDGIKKAFLGNEFVVFMELIEHEESPVYAQKAIAPKDSPAELTIKVRLRVIDLRKETPQIVLQEIVQDSHYIPKQFNRSNFTQVPWGKENFNISPLGMAHAQLSKEIATRLEEYILMAKNSLDHLQCL